MAQRTRRGGTNRRKGTSGPAGRRVKAAGTLISPRVMHLRATRLVQINAPSILSFRKKRAAAQAGRIHGLTLVNAPGSRRSTAGSRPSGHGINAPKGQW